MRKSTSNSRPAQRLVVPASKPRNPLLRAIARGLSPSMRGHAHQPIESAERKRERFLAMDFDQQVREIGEW